MPGWPGIGLDFDFLLGRTYTRLFSRASGVSGLGVDLHLFERFVSRILELGYTTVNARACLTWGLSRLVLQRGDPDFG